MTKFGDDLGIVEIDFFAAIARAVESGISRKEIDAAYRAALSQALNKPGRGKRGATKLKNINRRLAEMQDLLVADSKKKIYTAVREILEKVPENKEKLTPSHLAKSFKANRKLIRNLEILRLVKLLSEYLNQRPGYDRERELLQRLFEEMLLSTRSSTTFPDRFAVSRPSKDSRRGERAAAVKKS